MPEIPSAKLLAQGFSLAKAITKQYARTFYLASHFLDKDRRLAAYSLYAVCRFSDEAVDSLTSATSLENLNDLKAKIDASYLSSGIQEPLLLAFRYTVNKYAIPQACFDELISGMRMDLEKKRYKNFSELYEYSYKAAGVVGLMMVKVFGLKSNEAENFAIDLGVAFQLTNILRDIKEDFSRGRVYLPQDELHEFKVKEQDIAEESVTDNFKKLLTFQTQRVRSYYKRAEEGIPLISDRRSRFVTCAMKEMYEAILDEIENNDFDVYSSRAQVNAWKKFFILSGIIAKGRYL
jgi:phytoene synthase